MLQVLGLGRSILVNAYLCTARRPYLSVLYVRLRKPILARARTIPTGRRYQAPRLAGSGDKSLSIWVLSPLSGLPFWSILRKRSSTSTRVAWITLLLLLH